MTKPDDNNFFANESKELEWMRRLKEQQGNRKFAQVLAKFDASDLEAYLRHYDLLGSEAQEIMHAKIKQHIFLNSQRFDGLDNSSTPVPPANSAARREFDNAKNKQEQEKQLRLNPEYAQKLSLGKRPRFNPKPGM